MKTVEEFARLATVFVSGILGFVCGLALAAAVWVAVFEGALWYLAGVPVLLFLFVLLAGELPKNFSAKSLRSALRRALRPETTVATFALLGLAGGFGMITFGAVGELLGL